MASELRIKTDASAAFTITLASLADGSARQSDMIDNTTNRQGALVYLRIKSGASAPTAGTVYEVYLLRGDAATPNVTDDGAGETDAAITIENAQLLGAIKVTNDAAKNFYGVFDTWPLGPLGPTWGIAVRNKSGQALSATEADHVKRYTSYVVEAQ